MGVPERISAGIPGEIYKEIHGLGCTLKGYYDEYSEEFILINPQGIPYGIFGGVPGDKPD